MYMYTAVLFFYCLIAYIYICTHEQYNFSQIRIIADPLGLPAIWPAAQPSPAQPPAQPTPVQPKQPSPASQPSPAVPASPTPTQPCQPASPGWKPFRKPPQQPPWHKSGRNPAQIRHKSGTNPAQIRHKSGTNPAQIRQTRRICANYVCQKNISKNLSFRTFFFVTCPRFKSDTNPANSSDLCKLPLSKKHIKKPQFSHFFFVTCPRHKSGTNPAQILAGGLANN